MTTITPDYEVPDIYRYRYIDAWGHGLHATMQGTCRQYPVLRFTPKGLWYSDDGTERWVSTNSQIPKVWPSKKLALKSYRLRKVSQVEILKYQLARAEYALRWANNQQPPNSSALIALE